MIIIITAVLLTALSVYLIIENKRLAVTRYKIRLSGIGCDLRAVHLSDIHKRKYKNNWKKLISRVKKLSPDVIFLTGDLVSRTETDYRCKGILIRELCRICPVYCCFGNHELDLSENDRKRLSEEMTGNGAKLLDNDSAVFEKESQKITIYGATLKRSVYRNENNGFSGLDDYTCDELSDALGKPCFPSVLLAHDPFFLESYSQWGADIVFSGHVHGGLIGTPFGGLLSPERKFFPKFTKGVYYSKNTVMVLSAGIGKLRAFCPPEIVCADILKDTRS